MLVCKESYELREREIWKSIRYSKSTMINLQVWDLLKFTKKLQRKLKQAKETRLFGKSTIFDYEPEVKGCSQFSYDDILHKDFDGREDND